MISAVMVSISFMAESDPSQLSSVLPKAPLRDCA